MVNGMAQRAAHARADAHLALAAQDERRAGSLNDAAGHAFGLGDVDHARQQRLDLQLPLRARAEQQPVEAVSDHPSRPHHRRRVPDSGKRFPRLGKARRMTAFALVVALLTLLKKAA